MAFEDIKTAGKMLKICLKLEGKLLKTEENCIIGPIKGGMNVECRVQIFGIILYNFLQFLAAFLLILDRFSTISMQFLCLQKPPTF